MADFEHQWEQHPKAPWKFCKLCGVVKREDGRPQKECRGPVKLSLRG